MSTAAEQRVLAIATLKVDRFTGQVVKRMRSAGVRPILLKGPSIARWLYDASPARSYIDTDLLVGPHQARAAERVLSELGFSPGPESELHTARLWRRPDSRDVVDLHRSLTGLTVGDGEAWAVLSGSTDRIRVGGEEVEILDEPGRALHVALHAAHHGPRVEHPREDLRRAVARLDDDLWAAVLARAAELGAGGALKEGLSLQGGDLPPRLTLPADASSPTVRLRGRELPPGALWLGHVWETRSPRAAVRALVPTAEFMRHRSPLARRGALGLALAHLGRWLVFARHSGAAVRALRAALR